MRLVALAALAALAASAVSVAAEAAEAANADEQSVINALKAVQGATVQQGSFDFFTQALCDTLDTCYAENPLTPYGLAFLPRSPMEQPGYPNWCAHGICSPEGNSAAWRVTQGGEAIVLIGITPPECVYWSVTPYMYSRTYSADFRPAPATFRHRLAACPKGSGRCETFLGVNDPLNLATAMAGGDGAPERPFAVIVVFDAETEVRVKAAMAQAKPMQRGGAYWNDAADMAAINVLRVPGRIMRLGVSARHDEDDFSIVMRVRAHLRAHKN